MLSLSNNILCEIFRYLSFKELCVLSSVCKPLTKVCESNLLWQNSADPGSGIAKKHIFCLRGRITQNIFKKLRQVNILSGHSRTINNILIKGNKILTSSDDETVRLWNTKKLRGAKIIQHNDKVVSAAFWENGVVSVSADRTLKIWQKDREPKSEYAHRAGITQLKIIDGVKVMTGSYDGAVKIWDLQRFKNLVVNHDFDRDINLLETSQNYYCYTSMQNSEIYLRNFDRPDSLQKYEL